MRAALSEPHRCHVPATVVDQRSHYERPKEATQGIHGHSEGPQQCLEALIHGDSMPVDVGLVVEVLHVLE